MRFSVLVALLALAAPASAAEVRVKSKHDKVTLSASSLECQKVGPEETLRAGAIGPGAIKVTLRRLGDAKAAPIAVKLMRDGREVAKLSVGGKLKDAVAGDADLAGPPMDKAVEIPAGPHTLFVEVGPGAGAVLVSFDEVRGATPLVAKAPDKAEPAVAVAPKTGKAEPAAVAPKSGKAEPKAVKPAGKTDTKPGPTVAKASKLEEESEPAPVKPPARTGKLEEDAEPSRPQPVRTGKLEEQDNEPEPAAVVQVPTNQGEAPVRVLLGPRLGIASQTQLGAVGPALGLTLRWAVAGTSTAQGTSGLLIGLSADFVRYGLGFKLAQSSTLPAFTDTVTVLSVPIMLDATWCFGNPSKARISPYLGLELGLAAGALTTESPLGSTSEAFARLALGAHVGLELPIGRNRLGLEVRWLFAHGSTSSVRDLDVGGLMAQASWRFGL